MDLFYQQQINTSDMYDMLSVYTKQVTTPPTPPAQQPQTFLKSKYHKHPSPSLISKAKSKHQAQIQAEHIAYMLVNHMFTK